MFEEFTILKVKLIDLGAKYIALPTHKHTDRFLILLIVLKKQTYLNTEPT